MNAAATACECKWVSVTEVAGSVYDLPSIEAVIRYLHASLGFPTKNTLLRAIKHGNLSSFPGLTASAVTKYFPKSDETQKGHMRQSQQGMQSTKVRVKQSELEVEDDVEAEEEGEEGSITRPIERKKDVYVKVFDATKKAMCSDQAGRFPVISSRGHKYVMVAVELYGNYIDAEAMTSRDTKELIRAYQSIWKCWEATGVISPNWHVLDNEAPEEFKHVIRKNDCIVELTPADVHRRNIAEQAIQTWKGHFISVLAGVDEKFPLHEWDRLISQVTLTLNLLRQSNASPNVSAYAHHHGQFNYDKMPLAPMGCAVQFHEKPTRRRMFGEHASDGWYIRTSPEHYRCHIVLVRKTRHLRITDMVYFKHKYSTQPTLTLKDRLMKAILDLTRVISNKVKGKPDEQHQALTKIAEVFKPGNQLPILLTGDQMPPKVQPREQQVPRVHRTEQAPRVQWDENLHKIHQDRPTNKLIDASPKSILKQPKYSPTMPKTQVPEPNSIAARLLARRKERAQESANPVLDHETGKLFEYRKLLSHPKYAKAWNTSAANEFSRLAQGVGGRVQGTNPIFFIRKDEIPLDR